MADPNIHYQRWDADGVLVEDITTPKPVEQYNAEVIRERVATALASNATFLALASPTNAQAVAQVQLLTREVNAIIRLLVTQQFDDISGT